jgi:hypothetical protein
MFNPMVLDLVPPLVCSARLSSTSASSASDALQILLEDRLYLPPPRRRSVELRGDVVARRVEVAVRILPAFVKQRGEPVGRIREESGESGLALIATRRGTAGGIRYRLPPSLGLVY